MMGCDVMHKEKGIEGRTVKDAYAVLGKREQGDEYIYIKSTLLNGFQNKTINGMKADSW